MVRTKEYRICMPMTVEEYRIGQLYMVARHSFEQSGHGEGVEVVVNEQVNDEINGTGQYTEKKIHLYSRLPYWIQPLIPNIFYITEKAWNYYPYTITEYTCSFLPKGSISIQTRYEDNNGTTENCLNLTPEQLERREVDFLDIAYDEIKPQHYKEAEDPKFFKSEKTGRGPLVEGWRDTFQPIMCCYKAVDVKFEVWGFQTMAEESLLGYIRGILLLGHRQAFAWIDDWYNMTLDDVRAYEREMQARTNIMLQPAIERAGAEVGEESQEAEEGEERQIDEEGEERQEAEEGEERQEDEEGEKRQEDEKGVERQEDEDKDKQSESGSNPQTPKSPKSPKTPKSPGSARSAGRSWFPWS